MALSESLCVEIDMVSINSLLTLLIPEFGAKMISGNLEQIRAFVYSKRSLSPDFNAMVISLIDSINCFAFSESLFLMLSMALTTSIQMLSRLMVSSFFMYQEFYRATITQYRAMIFGKPFMK